MKLFIGTQFQGNCQQIISILVFYIKSIFMPHKTKMISLFFFSEAGKFQLAVLAEAQSKEQFHLKPVIRRLNPVIGKCFQTNETFFRDLILVCTKTSHSHHNEVEMI